MGLHEFSGQCSMASFKPDRASSAVPFALSVAFANFHRAVIVGIVGQLRFLLRLRSIPIGSSARRCLPCACVFPAVGAPYPLPFCTARAHRLKLCILSLISSATHGRPRSLDRSDQFFPGHLPRAGDRFCPTYITLADPSDLRPKICCDVGWLHRIPSDPSGSAPAPHPSVVVVRVRNDCSFEQGLRLVRIRLILK